MTKYFTERLYTLGINFFFKYSFFFFYLFAIETKDIALLKDFFFKSTYYNLKNTTNCATIYKKYSRLYIFYNHILFEVFSMVKSLFRLKELNSSNDNIFNTCLSYHSVLYTHVYYNNTLKYYFKNIVCFFKNNLFLLHNYIKNTYIYSIKYYKYINICFYLKHNVLCNLLFKKRFFFYDNY